MVVAFRTWILLATVILASACGAPQIARRPSTAPTAEVAGDDSTNGKSVAVIAAPEPGTAVPVTIEHPFRGDPLAPVTIVVWGDFQCPFTARLMTTLSDVLRTYGPQKVRFVWRNYPLPFHQNARPAAVAAETVLRLGGPNAFWTFHQLVFEHQKDLSEENYAAWAATAGIDRAAFARAFQSGADAQKVDDDIEAGKTVGVSGTPASFINGVFVSGAQPAEKFTGLIDEQLAAAEKLAQAGTPPRRIYAELSDKNYAKRPPTPSAPDKPADTTTVWKVPVGASPVRGKASALVTMVMFTDLQCPFCAKAADTLDTLQTTYGDRLRIVFKHNPLPFHPRAEPAAQLAIEARAQKGEAVFWKAVTLLFHNQQNLADADLDQYASTLGLDVARVDRAISAHKHAAVIEVDQDLADDLEANGTPHFFINGRRLVGAQPVEKFKAIIDEEIAHAEALQKRGVVATKLYDEMQKSAKSGAPLERIVVPAPTRSNPAKGASGARVVVQMFADFECPYCKKVQATLDELAKAFPGRVRIVWRNLPLPMHAHAQLAAEAAMEAFAQKGDAGFWAMAEQLFKDQSAAGLERPGLESKAAEVGLDLDRFRRALDQHTHKAEVDADRDLADRVAISGTPGFAINDYFVSGAQPLARFKRVVQHALGPKEPRTPESLHRPKDSTKTAAAGANTRAANAGGLVGAK